MHGPNSHTFTIPELYAHWRDLGASIGALQALPVADSLCPEDAELPVLTAALGGAVRRCLLRLMLARTPQNAAQALMVLAAYTQNGQTPPPPAGHPFWAAAGALADPDHRKEPA